MIVRVALNEKNFKELVNGKVTSAEGVAKGEKTPVEIVLSDIGFKKMQKILNEAMSQE
jgi:hypothetical protein